MKTISNDIFFSHVESELKQGRSVRFKVKGNSMFPFLRNGRDEVTVSPYTSIPEKMDIVLFRFRGKHVLHRIIGIEDSVYIIQGDGIYTSKEQCRVEDITGYVSAIHKSGKGMISTSSPLFKLMGRLWYCLRFCRRYLIFAIRLVYKY